jgi:RimJ/RimL family protein N-acetyltransferase
MALDVRILNSSDYDEILVGWWKDWGFTPPSKDFLPDNGAGGCMITDGDEFVCAGFLYSTNSKIAWVDWIISNKNYRKKPERSEAISLLVLTLTNIAKNLGNKYAYSLMDNERLIETYKKLGYIKSASYIEELIKYL